MSTDFNSIYEDLGAAEYLTKEDKETMHKNQTPFTITAIHEREQTFRGTKRMEWIFTLLIGDGEEAEEHLLTLAKGPNRDKYVERMRPHVPVSNVRLERVGKSEAWTFVPAGKTADKKKSASKATTVKK